MNEGFPVLNTGLEKKKKHDGFIQTCGVVLLSLCVHFLHLQLLSHNLSKHQLAMHSRFFNHLQISEIFVSVQLNENSAYQSELNGPDVVKGFFSLSLNVEAIEL